MVSKRRKWGKGLFLLFVSILAAGALVVLAAGLYPRPVPKTAGGAPRFTSEYVAMRDGVRIAVRVARPAAMGDGAKVPAVMEVTRYGTKSRPSFLLDVLLNLRIAKLAQEGPVDGAFTKAGFAFVAVDARGSGASFGARDMEFSREEAADTGEIIDWIARAPWSNGKVMSYGMSFSGNTAELAAASMKPDLVAAAPLYPDFDPIAENALPGGVMNEHLVKAWNAANQSMDKNQDHGIFFTGPAPVDGDGRGSLLGAAIAGHRSLDTYAAIRGIAYVDDLLGPGYTATDIAPWTRRADIEASGTPLYVRIGWLDAATATGAIERYLTYSNPQTLVIGPWSHGGWHAADPFLSIEKSRAELDAQQAKELTGFFQECMAEGGPSPRKAIRYYTFGEGAWKTADSWPVPGFELRRLFLAKGRSLSASPQTEPGSDRYLVDFTANTGEANRWRTNLGGGAVAYPDRSAEDGKLLCYTSEPLERDLEITGAPVARLRLSTSAEDGAVYVYLEDVAPDGKVTYITEGMLRLMHRKIPAGQPPHAVLGPWHSMLRADSLPVAPGEEMDLRIGLHPTSVLLRAGHRVRIAIAGHDASNFVRLPAEGDPELGVRTGGSGGSWIELPAKDR
jgi:uncharacterized protein